MNNVRYCEYMRSYETKSLRQVTSRHRRRHGD